MKFDMEFLKNLLKDQKIPHTNKDRHIQSVETILKDIENVFNTSLNPIERYLHASCYLIQSYQCF